MPIHAGQPANLLKADLHIHTVASPCAEIEMLPSLIVDRACELGLNCIAVTDHNTAANVEAVASCAARRGIRVIPGMEVQTREEVHMLCLFDTLEQVFSWQDIVEGALPNIKNRDDVFGVQLVVDENDEYIRTLERLLLVAADLTIEQVTDQVNKLGGVVVAAHVDRQAYSLLSVLGFIPPDLQVAALEMSRATDLNSALEKFPQLVDWPLITNSDAHRLDEMQRSMQFQIPEFSIRAIAHVWQTRYISRKMAR